ncbi:MAG: DUF4364 family protein [Lachnospiraceae bacterium]
MAEAQTIYKLIILSMLDQVDFPLTNAQLSDFILTKEYTNYFTLQQVISELLESGLIDGTTVRNSSYYRITEEGKATLDYFGNMISPAINEDIQNYFSDHMIALRDEASVIADYYKNTNQEFSARLQVLERGFPLIDLTLSVPTKEQANSICNHWKTKNQKIYAYLMQELL